MQSVASTPKALSHLPRNLLLLILALIEFRLPSHRRDCRFLVPIEQKSLFPSPSLLDPFLEVLLFIG